MFQPGLTICESSLNMLDTIKKVNGILKCDSAMDLFVCNQQPFTDFIIHMLE